MLERLQHYKQLNKMKSQNKGIVQRRRLRGSVSEAARYGNAGNTNTSAIDDFLNDEPSSSDQDQDTFTDTTEIRTSISLSSQTSSVTDNKVSLFQDMMNRHMK